MDITICENLKKLRKQKGNKQEDLADHLGVSMQAVSKWERGECYPDITLVPAIAFYYNVTIDHLFGMEEEKIEAKIKEYDAKALEISQTIKNMKVHREKQIILWREAQKEFPNNHKILMRVMFMLSVPLYVPRAISSNDFDEIVQLGERLLAESTDNALRSQAIKVLCDVYANEKDFESAKKYANMLPSFYDGKEMVYGRCLSGEERIKYQQGNIRAFIVNGINSYFIQDMLQCHLSVEELIKMYEFSYKLWHLLYSDGDFGYYEQIMGGTCHNLSNWHSSLGNTDEALFYLSEMADHYIKAEQYFELYTPGGNFKHTSFMINRLNDPEHNLSNDSIKTTLAQFIQRIENTESFDDMRDDERYVTAIEKMKSIL